MARGKIVIYSLDNTAASLIAEVVAASCRKVICCHTADQTVATCLREEPDLVIILLITPFMDGSELIRRIRHSNRRRPPIYVISWQQSEQTVLSLLECGVDQYLTFPICMGRLRGKAFEQMKTGDGQ